MSPTTDPLGLEHVGGTGPGRPPDKILNELVSIDDARYICVKDLNGKASTINSFLLHKQLGGLIGDVDEVRRLFSGDLRITTKSAKQTRDILKLKTLCGRSVEITAPFWWNTCVGIAYGECIGSMTSDEIIEGIHSIPGNPKVAMVKHFTRPEGGRFVNLNLAKFTFATKTLPAEIKLGYENAKVRLFIPEPLRCYACQDYGHGKNKCTAAAHCAKCDSVEHDRDNCPEGTAPKCHNCGLDHTSWSRDCAVYKHEKEICTYKVTKDVSYRAARIAVDKQVKETFAAKAAASATPYAPAKPVMDDCSTQTPLTFPPLPDLLNVPFMSFEMAALYRALPNQMLGKLRKVVVEDITPGGPSPKPSTSATAETQMNFDDIVNELPIGPGYGVKSVIVQAPKDKSTGKVKKSRRHVESNQAKCELETYLKN